MQGIVNATINQQSVTSHVPSVDQDLTDPSGSSSIMEDSQDPPLSQDNLKADLQVVCFVSSIPCVQSVSRDYWEALDFVFDVILDQISKPPVQNHDSDDCSDLYLPISSSLRRSLRMSDSYLLDLHSRNPLLVLPKLR